MDFPEKIELNLEDSIGGKWGKIKQPWGMPSQVGCGF